MPDALTDFLATAMHEQETFQAIHLNHLDVGWTPSLHGLELLEICLNAFERAAQHLRTHRTADAELQPRLALYLPLGCSNTITFWFDETWSKLGEDPEPPSLYLLRTEALFDDEAEEYRCPIPVPTAPQVRAVFRCFRSQEFRRNGWEFSLGVYVC